MTPKVVRWVGAAIVFGIIGLLAAAALHDIIAGEPDVRAEVATLALIVVIVVAAAVLRARSRRLG